ncbi:NYN domain-containing protein [Gaiella occulta]|uniref:NYN domain-containing protein n=1 Tax=Gaiella occulta TaxID=1002870 RepID=A0A7M2YX01_9ACTN|nr:NYN domain-containing protein [Gaiella occulta]RDI74260.1 NYN domain-containing protein [Gaiella occulta]
MDRFGVFVDAGYLYAASGKLLFGTTDRKKFSLNFESIVERLIALGKKDSGSSYLRTYWYDGARNAVPSAQHLIVANLSGVKLRLGRLTPHGQKGVDSRIVRDLIVLATQQAISTAYLIGGDEDLREGVSEAQERGVRVVLVGVEPLNEQNLSPTLAMESDDVLVLKRDFVERHFRLRDPEFVEVIEPADPTDVEAHGGVFALAWSEKASPEELGAVIEQISRSIPPEIDRQLLAYGAGALKVGRLADEPKRQLRLGFGNTLKSLGASAPTDEEEDT